VDRVSIERMCAGREFQVEGADRGRCHRGGGKCTITDSVIVRWSE